MTAYIQDAVRTPRNSSPGRRAGRPSTTAESLAAMPSAFAALGHRVKIIRSINASYLPSARNRLVF